MGISFSFIDVGDRLERPFAGASGGGTASAAAASIPSTVPTVCRQVTLSDVNVADVTDGSSQTTLTFTPEGSDVTLNVSVSPPNCTWSLNGVPAWAPLSDGGLERRGSATLTFTASPNDTGSPREETVAINGLGQSFKLTQETP